jgi:methionine-rich copper-binding protein CopC
MSARRPVIIVAFPRGEPSVLVSVRLRPKRLTVVAVLGMLLGVVMSAVPSTSSAHANLRRADPAPNSTVSHAPAQIQMQFGQPAVPDPRTRVRVLLPSGHDAALGPAAASGLGVSQRLGTRREKGWYRVQYAVVFVDGHLGTGVFRFRVGDVDAPPPHHGVMTSWLIGLGVLLAGYSVLLAVRRERVER